MPQQHATISNADLFNQFLPNAMLVYFCRKRPEITPDEMRARLAELLKFLILVREFPGNIIFGMEIDDLWHLWIMQTREYDALCRALPGGEFRHHSSRDYPEVELDDAACAAILATDGYGVKDAPAPDTGSRARFDQNAQRLLSFLASYYNTFGPIHTNVIPLWPPVHRLTERLGWESAQLNAFLDDQVRKAQGAKAGLAATQAPTALAS